MLEHLSGEIDSFKVSVTVKIEPQMMNNLPGTTPMVNIIEFEQNVGNEEKNKPNLAFDFVKIHQLIGKIMSNFNSITNTHEENT